MSKYIQHIIVFHGRRIVQSLLQWLICNTSLISGYPAYISSEHEDSEIPDVTIMVVNNFTLYKKSSPVTEAYTIQVVVVTITVYLRQKVGSQVLVLQ
jgi:hypothetical protein